MKVKKLTPSGSGWSAGTEFTLSQAGSVWWGPSFGIVDRGQGPLGRRLAAAYATFNLWQYDYAVHLSDDGGDTWYPAPSLPNYTPATLGMAGDRLIAIQAGWTELTWREWTTASWSDPRTITNTCCQTGHLPSVVTTDDGALHAAGERSGTVWYAKLDPGASDFSSFKWLGVGKDPVISTTGASLFIFATPDPNQGGTEGVLVLGGNRRVHLHPGVR